MPNEAQFYEVRLRRDDLLAGSVEEEDDNEAIGGGGVVSAGSVESTGPIGPVWSQW